MKNLLITNIRGLVQVRPLTSGPLRGAEMSTLPTIENAFLEIRDGRIGKFGPMAEMPDGSGFDVLDANNGFVLPCFVDSHTHLIFPASREDEFVLKIKGATYAEIAAKGGGILNSARKLAHTSEDELFDSALKRLNEIAATGTGAVEIKSGYGLSVEGELKMLRVARRLKQESQLTIRTTFLGAHAVPAGMKKDDYVRSVIDEMIPAVAAEGLADFIDVFCERGFFSQSDSEAILNAGAAHGMKGRVHANQLSRSGGVQAGIRSGAISVDHLENIGEEEIQLLSASNTIATALPGAAFFLNLPMPPARDLINANVPLVIASDYNPGSSPSGNMMQMISLACIRMRITPEEAINATTINAAYALELHDQLGSITEGKLANVIVTRAIPSIAYLPYAFGSSHIARVIVNGNIIPAYSA